MKKTIKVGKVKAVKRSGKLVFMIIEAPKDVALSDLHANSAFQKRKRKLEKDTELIRKSALVDPTRLHMRFTG